MYTVVTIIFVVCAMIAGGLSAYVVRCLVLTCEQEDRDRFRRRRD